MQFPPAGNVIRFSTDSVSGPDRISFLRDFFGKTIVKLDLEPLDRHHYRQTCALMALPDLNLATGVTSGIVGSRTRALVADGNDDLIFTTNLSGSSVLSQGRREIRLNSNEAVLLSSAEIGSQAFPESGSYVSLSIPRHVLGERVSHLEDKLMQPFQGDHDALRLLVDYVDLAMNRHKALAASLQSAFVTHVHDLVALAVGATRDGAALAQGRGVRAARLSAIKADVILHMREENLSVHDVARRHGVTPRYVQLLFESTGQTFSEFLLEQRLIRARRMLADRAYADWTISAIAFEVGFGNLSWFNRTFRRQYGISPSDMRYAGK